MAIAQALHGQPRELEAGDPALGALGQHEDVFGGEVQSQHPVEEGVDGIGGEAKVGGPQLGELAPDSQAGKGQRRVLPGGEDQVQALGLVADQEAEGLVDIGRLDDVVVVEDEQHGPGPFRELVDQGGDHRAGGRKRAGEWGAHPGQGAVEGGREGAPEARRVVVVLVQGKPCDGPAGVQLGEPFAHQGGLAEAGRGRDQRQSAAESGM
ncbi:hypothetical protein D3C72_1467760 [compost metagenome]